MNGRSVIPCSSILFADIIEELQSHHRGACTHAADSEAVVGHCAHMSGAMRAVTGVHQELLCPESNLAHGVVETSLHIEVHHVIGLVHVVREVVADFLRVVRVAPQSVHKVFVIVVDAGIDHGRDQGAISGRLALSRKADVLHRPILSDERVLARVHVARQLHCREVHTFRAHGREEVHLESARARRGGMEAILNERAIEKVRSHLLDRATGFESLGGGFSFSGGLEPQAHHAFFGVENLRRASVALGRRRKSAILRLPELHDDVAHALFGVDRSPCHVRDHDCHNPKSQLHHQTLRRMIH